jgi:hypothetical protein
MQIVTSKTKGDANTAKTLERGISIHFIDGTCLNVSFPLHEDKYKRALMVEEVLKKRVLLIEADGEIRCIPFENIKFMNIRPVAAAEVGRLDLITGAQISE